MLNERIRNINNILERLDHDRYMHELKLSAIFGPDLMKECKGLIEDLRETRHKKVMERQKLKFERLWDKKQHSGTNLKNGSSNQVQRPSVPNKQWVVNLSSTPT